MPVVVDVPEPPAPTGDRLLLRVEASSVNGTDLGAFGGGLTAAVVRRVSHPGFDVAGEVLSCGPEVTAFAPGDRVMALLGHSGGGQAERVVFRQEQAARVPVSCSAAEAASLPLAGLTALQALYGRAALRARRSPRVLVVGASGGIGAAAVQLARLVGAHVTGVASGRKLDFVAGLGAQELVDRHEREVTALGRRFDVVLDTPGRLLAAAARPLLADDGVFVTTRGAGPDSVRELVPGRLRRGGPAFATVRTRPRSADLAHLAALVDGGDLRPVVDRVFPLAQVEEAYRHVRGAATGKVVVATSAVPVG
ncbi:NAD(P)-dependent alcohol dehydrogenase [Geodermatophilus sp. DSM 44513]|uniref:NAD(P)-dependent alcohol dehydrogenase n=1 Tax=Geodermatophilus sp. DSM 44513 TaxID=1528104 RepID=UPI00141365DD|nr:NAD(P)-dependent alcohol dehydrogenase [Geodermatophilus sp. DSM 44513]WNV76676.1 NAD(P)-dependent alcohol dehydrogenase [Geodermatophilus sp. DSM 44513]